MGEGRIQELYRIYYEWFKGNKESALALLAGSTHYIKRKGVHTGVGEDLRLQVRLVLSQNDALPPVLERLFLSQEGGGGGCIEADSHERVLELLEKCDTTSPRTMIDILSQARLKGLRGDDRRALQVPRQRVGRIG